MKHFLIKCCALFLLTVSMSGCYTYNQLGKSLNNSVGQSETDLRVNYGPPDNIINNADAGVVWVYSRLVNVSTTGVIVPTNYGAYYTAPTNYTGQQTIKFWIGANKRVYKWQTDGHRTTRYRHWVWPTTLLGGFAGGWLLGMLLFG